MSKKPTSKQTYKSEIVRELLTEFPNATTMAVARECLKRYPLDFKSLESARGLVRANRGELNFIPIEGTVAERNQKEKKLAMSKFALPESDYDELPDFVVPVGNNRGLIMNDIHLPYQDNNALEVAINYGIKFKPNFVYLNGDTIDMYQGSRFIKDRRLRDLAGELEITRGFLKELQRVFDCPIYFKMGNHEERWENYLRLNAPELLGIDDFNLCNILRFGEFGVTEVKGKQMARIGKFNLLHGHEFGHSVFSPVNAARGLYMRAKASSAVGHHHQTSEHTEKDLNGNIVTTWSIGSLCGLSPEYMPYNKWNHGFATIETDMNGDYDFRNLRIINGKVR
jgi:hypothetical protein